ncbi:MAG TPA: hypothetical protein PK953_04290 [Smithellaceae bacterium]|nr:hypothetical protein [Smithellaceae bacterium]HQC10113.1 hypothetical protein [Smithellaceae bacterium]
MRTKDLDSRPKITPDELLALIGTSPADNLQGLSTSVSWKSKWVGELVRQAFDYQNFLNTVGKRIEVFGPWALACAWQSSLMDTYVTGPIRAQARMAAGAGRNPDLFSDMNGWIYKGYSRLLYTMTGFFIEDGKFSREKAGKISTTKKGYEFLKNYMEEFAQIEHSYNNIGLTRLKAMKELLKCLLVVITETPPASGELPFASKASGEKPGSFEDYLALNRTRLENLYRENVFDIKDYSERVTGGKIGFSRYEYVEGSTLHRVRLRDYPTPRGLKSNGKILYMVTPLINKPELFDLAAGKSVIEGMHKEGYRVYLVDHGDPGWEETELELDFYGKTLHDHYLRILRERHPRAEILIMAYCMGGTLILPYLARRAEELLAAGKPMDVKKVALMASPVKFDDGNSGHAGIRALIRRNYDPSLMKELFGAVNIPPQVIEFGMNEIQPAVQYNVVRGFYERAENPEAIADAAPFLYWLTHGTRFPVSAHVQWIQNVFMDNQIYEGKFRLPSTNPKFDGQPVNMDMLRKVGVAIFEYKGSRDPIAPAGSCVAADIWGLARPDASGRKGRPRNVSIEKNIGHIFVGSRRHLAQYLAAVNEFYRS